ncbi:hypothetical protein TSUD_135220 [Trifolium subterraneum]|uniref:Uncharacterized protein n=1 Tax=Trifolium subterraneum TaxID=3900 RepID=A0A2Z6NFG6_TRISU|nr:hypothetical protein TSUD_135220 [Trifolium subterraneum]
MNCEQVPETLLEEVLRKMSAPVLKAVDKRLQHLQVRILYHACSEISPGHLSGDSHLKT